MMLKKNTSLGIDISESCISFALLKKCHKGITLIKADQVPTPKDAVIDGNIVSHQSIAKAIRRLLKKNRVNERQAAISLLADPVLSQIIDLPEKMPANIDKFIQSGIKNSTLLSRKEYHYDFCMLTRQVQDSAGKVLVEAANIDKIVPMIKALSKAAIEVPVVELPAIAWARTVNDKLMRDNYKKNALTIYGRGSKTFICVFRKGHLDFIRSVDFGHMSVSPDEYAANCTEQINAVRQYYDIEVETQGSVDWQVVLYLDHDGATLEDFHGALQDKLKQDVYLCRNDQISMDTAVQTTGSVKKASLTAVGLAMHAFQASSSGISINLLPQSVQDITALKRFVLITANVAAAAVLLMFVYVGMSGAKINETYRAMQERKENIQTDDIASLLERKRSLENACTTLESNSAMMSQVFEGEDCADWAAVLDEVGMNIPKDMCITRLECSQDNDFTLQGNALSYESPHSYAKLLEESGLIASAVVSEANSQQGLNGMIDYTINCQLQQTQESIE